MSVVNRRNAVLGWTVWALAKQELKRKARHAVPGTVEGTKRPNASAAVLTTAAAGAGALWFWRRREHETIVPAG